MDVLLEKLFDHLGRQRWVWNLFFLLVFGITYLPTLGGDFFTIDDWILLNAPQLRSGLGGNVLWTIFVPGNHVDHYPLRDLSYVFNRMLLGDGPTSFRLGNLFLALGCGFLLQSLLLYFGVKKGVAIAVSWLWCFMPFHAEMFVWISARKDILALFFALLSVLFYLKLEKRGGWIVGAGSTLSFVFSLLSKASVFPLAYLLVLRVKTFSRAGFFAMVLVLLATGLAFFHYWFYQAVNPLLRDDLVPLSLRLGALGQALGGWLWPSWNLLHLDGYQPISSWVWILGALFLSLMGALFLVGIVLRDKFVLFLSLGSFFLLLPVPGFFFSHRFVYSTRYFEPLFLFLLVCLTIRFSRAQAFKVGLFVGLIAATGATNLELKHWEEPYLVSLKTYRAHPHNLYTRLQLLLDLRSLEAWGKLSEQKELAKTYSEVAEGFLETCRKDISPAKALPECLQAYLNLANGETLTVRVRRQLEQGELPAPAMAEGRWQPTEEARVLKWQVLCLHGRVVEARDYADQKSKRSLLGSGVLSEAAAKAHPAHRAKLKACLTQKSPAG